MLVRAGPGGEGGVEDESPIRQGTALLRTNAHVRERGTRGDSDLTSGRRHLPYTPYLFYFRGRPPRFQAGRKDVAGGGRTTDCAFLPVCMGTCLYPHASAQTRPPHAYGRTFGWDIWTLILFDEMARHSNYSQLRVESFCREGQVSKCPSGCGGLAQTSVKTKDGTGRFTALARF